MSIEPTFEYDISVVVTAHAEGRLAHRTMRSIEAAILAAKDKQLRTEIIVVLDNPTPQTQAYFEHWRNKATVMKVSNRDPGINRNMGVEMARGKYVAIIDADDLFGRDWLALAYKRAEECSLEHFIVHAEYTIYFEGRHEVAKHFPSNSPDFEKSRLVGGNYWTSVLFAPRETFRKCPFLPSTLESGFGYEDWLWIASVLSEGGEVIIAPRTCKGTRYKATGSRLYAHGEMRALMRPCKFYEPRFFAKQVARSNSASPSNPATQQKASWLSRPRVKAWIGSLPKVLSRLTEWCPPVQKAMGALYRHYVPKGIQRASVPDWLFNQWQNMGTIEPQMYPKRATLREMSWFQWPDWPMGDEYEAICRVLADFHDEADFPQFTHIYLIPGLKNGESDSVSINYINGVASHPGHRVLVIATEDRNSPWKSKLSNSVAWLDYSGICSKLGWGRRQWLLAHLLVQLQANVIHVIQSALGSETLVHHGWKLNQISRLFQCAFFVAIDEEGKKTGIEINQLPDSEEFLTGIFSNNQAVFDYLQKTFASDPIKNFVHYQPIVVTDRLVAPSRSRDGKMHVLWAGRLSQQKRPDVLLKIAQECRGTPIHFHVYGSSDMSWKKLEVELAKGANVTFHGPFDDLLSLSPKNFQVFLNTSQFDGLPNIMLEAIVAGLPIVSSDVGGIGELIHHQETGLLVSSYDDTAQYVSALRMLLENEDLGERLVRKSRELVASRHTWEKFVAALNEVPGYLLHAIPVPTEANAILTEHHEA